MDTHLQSPSSSSSSSSQYPADEDNTDNTQLLASTSPKKRAGRKVFKETRHPVYRGVWLRNSGKWPKWVCEVREPTHQKRIWLGTHSTVEMAARAHDVAAIAFRGKSACLNFSDSAWLLPVPASSDIKDVQMAAAQAAKMFRPGKIILQEETITTSTTTTVDAQKVGLVMEDEEEQEANSQLYNMEDDGDVFRTPAFLFDMFSGMMLPPPTYFATFDSLLVVDDDSHLDFDFPLWTTY